MRSVVFSRVLLGLLFVAAGVLHFVFTPAYVRVMPSFLPYPRELVYLSGAAEIAGGLGVLLPGVRRAAGWGLILLLIAVFPANIQMAYASLQKHGLSLASVLLLLRLPLQFALIAWVDHVTRPPKPG